MTIDIKLNGKIMIAVSGAVKDAVYGLMNKTRTPEETKKYLIEVGILSGKESKPTKDKIKEYGYVDFDQLTENGNPTIIGRFYKENTVFGLKLSGKL